MVKTRRSNGENGDVDEGNYTINDVGSVSDEKASNWSQRELRSSQQYKVTRKIQHWPTKYSRRRRTIKMPRIVFPESDTEPEKYSRRSRQVRVFFAEDNASTNRSVRIRHSRGPRKNYVEDSEDKPIQENVRRSCRKRKLIHHNFNESWITNELKVKGYPDLYGFPGTSSSDEFSSGDEARVNKKITRDLPPTNTDEDTQLSARQRRTSARFNNSKKTNDASGSDSEDENNQTVIEKKTTNESKKEKETDEGAEPKEEVKNETQEANQEQDSESNQAPVRSTRRNRGRPKKEDSQQETASESSSSESGSELGLQPRRSKRTRKPKPAFVQIAQRETRGRAKTFTIRKKPYSLRERKPTILRRKTIRSQSPSSSSSSMSSSDTEEDLNVSMKNKTKGRQKSKSMDDKKTDRALRDIQPVEVDGSVRFTSVGGLEEHIKCLREMVLFPLMYPDLFQKFGTRPAKGVLFHGPPGTGKTLLARALANECTLVGGRKVAFFMRKGADCLKKWVGESERHLKLLFQQANKMKPSIIFFDEIDALAPVRSVRQEQVHTSVVGTLLAEMDGLCDRGEVVIIGATNRLDAVDPALRRAGRFDRELYFPPPHAAARRDILHIYTKHWTPRPGEEALDQIAQLTVGYGVSARRDVSFPPPHAAARRDILHIYTKHWSQRPGEEALDQIAQLTFGYGGESARRDVSFPPPHAAARRDILHIYTKHWTPRPGEEALDQIAQLTVGYGGSDLKALCSESVLKALRRVYPQVYDSEHALLIDAKNVEVTTQDMLEAMRSLVAAGARACPPPARRLPPPARPLLLAQLQAARQLLPPILLMSGPCAETFIAPALLSDMEDCTVKELSMLTLHSALAFTPEQALISVSETKGRCEKGAGPVSQPYAQKQNTLLVTAMITAALAFTPEQSLISVSAFGLAGRGKTDGCTIFALVWLSLAATGTALLLQLWRTRAAGDNTLLLATTTAQHSDLPAELQDLFPLYKDCVYRMREPNAAEVIAFLKPLIAEALLDPPPIENTEPPPPLPRAPPPPPPRESQEDMARRKRKEDYKLRELRIFLRDICRKLASNRRFYKFTKPVDLEEVTDYLDIVKQPMDLETMMTKVDMHKYNCAKEFLDDIDLICANALEYNPDRTSSDKQIRHEACSLRDHAHALIDVEMDSDFEVECQEIAKKRREEGDMADADLPDFIYTASNLRELSSSSFFQPQDVCCT
ncbi:ATPase family AAA domain-containing protein 2-like [Ostrinia nubilalis]|uniref:ATPase family AAA domain-containing protein 2-like n=1 Tax=Ostrinia nubilalis TaxID=29057 RepID=UPI0030825830